MNFQSKPLIASFIVVALVVVAAGFWYWSQKEAEISETPADTSASGVEVKDGLGAEVFKKSNNPLSNELPETNPFRVDTNPFK